MLTEATTAASIREDGSKAAHMQARNTAKNRAARCCISRKSGLSGLMPYSDVMLAGLNSAKAGSACSAARRNQRTGSRTPVSYTHLTLPTKRIVEILVGAVIINKKKGNKASKYCI
eukprot:TRINITY_DN24466_c0_g3_i1.p1 TRINITY_DN24466_c0_g3~~TRINITY_DN24466_c0_g3_i1.p1  ORF type:complete len:116 (+),score=0.70 TRINITY_DN24466_c0_g3_i1:191-538(+)